MTDSPKEYAITIKVRNNYLLQRMRAAGYQNANELARATGVSNTAIGKLLNLKEGAINHWEKWRKSVLRLAEHLKCLPEDIVPPQHQRIGLKRNVAELEASPADLSMFVSSHTIVSPEVEYRRDEVQHRIEELINSLTPREQQIVRLRFGFDCDPKTSEEIADHLGITSGRVHQIANRILERFARGEKYRNHELRKILQEQEVWE